VNFLKKYFLLLVFCIVHAISFAQEDEPVRKREKILDDSTKQVYGPTTSRYYFEEAVFNGVNESYIIDTLIRDFHLYNFVQKLHYEYQDLGNVATAMVPIYYKLPSQIGRQSGINSFDTYWDLEPIRYFDTRSPYSNMNVILGGNGRSMTKVVYSRNITPNWDFGFNFRGLFVDKQLQRQGKGDRNVRSNYYDGFMTYHTKDSTYWVFANFKRLRHVVFESGGVLVDNDFKFEDFFDQFAQPNLTGAENSDLRTNFHVYHQYKIKNAMQVYHKFDKYRQFAKFLDKSPVAAYYGNKILGGTSVSDEQLFKTTRNELGVKGNAGRFFYNGYWAVRNFSIDYQHVNEDNIQLRTSGNEYYVGGKARLDVSKTIQASAETELLLATNYKFKANIRSPWLEASLARYDYRPTFIQQYYVGTYDGWSNNFANVEANQLTGFAHYRSKVVTLTGGATLTTLRNYVYFNNDPSLEYQQVLPKQSDGNQIIQSPEARVEFTFAKKIRLTGKAVYSSLLENANDAVQLPEWMLHGQLSWANIYFRGSLDFQVGIEAHWQSGYYANGYDVPTQQFYRQRTFRSNDYLVLDGFFNWKMKRGRMFFKYNNIVQAIKGTGYFPTPYYPAQANVFDFGFDWSFYD
jgi:Putative porin